MIFNVQIKWVCNEDYCLFGCVVYAVSRCTGGTYCSIFWAARIQTLGGHLTAATVGSVHHQAQQFQN
jgi:hypothetical protein